MQRSVGQWWIRTVTNSLRHVHGIDRLPAWDPDRSVICVANHRSFFDLYITTAELVAEGLPHRIVFPVRANFFYDHPLGLFVNGVMSFFAMYPPVFRERERAALNLGEPRRDRGRSCDAVGSSWALRLPRGRGRRTTTPTRSCPRRAASEWHHPQGGRAAPSFRSS